MTVSLTWWGHSTSTWRDNDTTVLFDPVLTTRLGHLRRVRGPLPPARAVESDLILLSHLHPDHTHLPSLRLVPGPGVVVAPQGSGKLLAALAGRGLSVMEVRPGDHLRIAGLDVRVLPADHDGRRHPGSPYRGPALGFLIEGSRRCWYPGDTGPAIGYEEIAPVDVALVPVGGWGPTLGRGHLNAHQAADAVRLTRAAWAVPVHWGTWWPLGLPQQPRRIDRPGPSFAEHAARLAPDARIRILAHGESLVVDSPG